MTVHPEAANDILLPQGDVPVNLISIFGAARGGKVRALLQLFYIEQLQKHTVSAIDINEHRGLQRDVLLYSLCQPQQNLICV
jgi:hypothetical protein